MKSTRRPKVGDVFAIPTGDGRVGVGQIVASSGRLKYFAVFDGIFPESEAPEQLLEAVKAPILFLGVSMPTKITAGEWTVLGTVPIDERIEFPAYKEAVGFPPVYEVVDYTGTRRRPATDLEAEVLPFRKVVSPAYFEGALRAHLQLEPWLDAFDALRPKGGISSDDLFSH